MGVASTVPTGWTTVPLGALGTLIKGRGIKRDEVSEDGVPCIRYGEIYTRYDNYVHSPVSRIPRVVAATALPLKTGDLLFAASGETAKEIGKCVAYLGEGEAYAGGDIVVLRPSTGNSLYLGHLLNHPSMALQKARLGQGDAVVHISARNLASLELLLPSDRNEQDRIAEALSNVDELLAGLDALIAKKRMVKQGTMQQLLSGETRLPGFSGEWVTAKLGTVGRCLRGVSYDPERDLASNDTDTSFRLLRSQNVRGASVVTNDLQYVASSRVSTAQIMQENDVLICMANGSKELVGKAGLFRVFDGHRYTFGAFMGCFRTERLAAVPLFVFYLFQTHRFRRVVHLALAGSSINNLSPSQVEAAEFPMPQRDEQAAISTVLSDMDAEIEALGRQREKTRQIKQGMMQELLTGRTRLI